MKWRRRSKSNREYCHHSLVTPTSRKRTRRFPPFPWLHIQSVHGLGWVKIWADIDIFQRYPTLRHARTALHLMCVYHVICLTRCRAYTRLFHPFQGSFSPPPSNVLTKPSVSERCQWEMPASKWVCGLDRVAKQKHCIIYSFGLSLPSFPCRRNDWPLHMHHAC
jgi:hypothetical protein